MLKNNSRAPFEVMVTRQLDVDGEPIFLIEIGKPYAEADGTWFCPYRIQGPTTSFVNRDAGVDGMQALLNVLYVLSAKAETSVENQEGRLTWGGQSEHFGFPSHEADPELREARRRQGR